MSTATLLVVLGCVVCLTTAVFVAVVRPRARRQRDGLERRRESRTAQPVLPVSDLSLDLA